MCRDIGPLGPLVIVEGTGHPSQCDLRSESVDNLSQCAIQIFSVCVLTF